MSEVLGTAQRNMPPARDRTPVRESTWKAYSLYFLFLRKKIAYETKVFLKKTRSGVRSFFKDYLFGSPQSVKRYKNQSRLGTFFVEINRSLDSKYALIGRMGLVLLFVSFFVVSLGLATVRTKSKAQLREQIRVSENISHGVDALSSYYDLQDRVRKESSLLFNRLCKAQNIPLVNFESEYKTLHFAANRKDFKTLRALRMCTSPTDGNLYYRSKDNKLILVYDYTRLQ